MSQLRRALSQARLLLGVALMVPSQVGLSLGVAPMVPSRVGLSPGMALAAERVDGGRDGS
ncbi:hypothetical protein DMB66_38140 [Actinoplanes sp. ATCC 53533]|nr:hypothetical protein DMB66_38140 [Actinoplanes sp. ATCC 53533]